MIHCFQTQELVVKPDHLIENQTGQSYFAASGQQQQQVNLCQVCRQRLPCACSYPPASNDFYAEQRGSSKASSADSSPKSSALATNQHHLQQQQPDSSQTSNHHINASSNQISASSSCADGDLQATQQQQQEIGSNQANQDDKQSLDEQTEELYGKLYADIETSRHNVSWTTHLNGFNEFPTSSSGSSSLEQRQRHEEADYLQSNGEHNEPTVPEAPSTSSLQDNSQAYRQATGCVKRQPCNSLDMNDFNNNKNNQSVASSAANDQQRHQSNGSLLFAPLMPIIETTPMQNTSNDQRNGTDNDGRNFYEHQYNSTSDYLGYFSANMNECSSSSNKLNGEKHELYDELDQQQHHQDHHHEQNHSHNNHLQPQQQQQEHSPSSTSSRTNSNERQQQQSNADFYHHHYQAQNTAAGSHEQYNQRAIRLQENSFGSEITTSSAGHHNNNSHHHHHQQQQQSSIFQDYYNYSNCDSINASDIQQQQYHGQDAYQDPYQTSGHFNGANLLDNQSGAYSSVAYAAEAPKVSNLYQLQEISTTTSESNQLHLISSTAFSSEQPDRSQSESAAAAAANSNKLDGAEIAGDQNPAIRVTDTSNKTLAGNSNNKPPISRSRRGRPRKKSGHSKGKVSGKLWEFIRDLLLNERTNPSFIRWERREDGVFKFVQSDKVAKMWGERKQNPKMTYEKLSRAMRYYYKSKVLLPVFGRRLVYKFGPNATGWMCSVSSASSSPSLSRHSNHSSTHNLSHHNHSLNGNNHQLNHPIENDLHMEHVDHLDQQLHPHAPHHHHNPYSLAQNYDFNDHHHQQQFQQQPEHNQGLLGRAFAHHNTSLHYDQETDAAIIY